MLAVEIVVVLVLIVLNGLFSMAELALVSASRARLQGAAEKGSKGAARALELKADPGRLLSAVQIAITLIGILAGTLGGQTLGERLALWLSDKPGFIGTYSSAIALSVVVLIITYLSLILGELVPKRLAMTRPEPIATGIAGFMRSISRGAAPMIWFLTASTNLVLKLIPGKEKEESAVTEEEINLMLREGAAAGHFHVGETEIVQMALRLGDRTVGAVMTPRTQVEWLDLADPAEERRKKVLASPYSRFPVCDGSPDNVAGILQVKDVLSAVLSGDEVDIRKVLKPPLFIPDTVTVLRALEMFKKSGEPMAFVVDEYGDFEGIVTLHDILQALVGDIASPGDETDPSLVKRDDGSFLIDGMLSLDQLKDQIQLAELPSEADVDYHTVGGFMMAQIRKVPNVGDKFLFHGWRFEVVDMDGRRVDRILAVPPKEPPAASTREA